MKLKCYVGEDVGIIDTEKFLDGLKNNEDLRKGFQIFKDDMRTNQELNKMFIHLLDVGFIEMKREEEFRDVFKDTTKLLTFLDTIDLKNL